MDYVLALGRILYALIFLYSGFGHLMRLDAMADYARRMGIPAPRFLVGLTGVQILLGGLSVLLGYQARWGAVLLLVFLVPTAFLMHPYWRYADPVERGNQLAHFQKTLALAGGALLILYYGAGPLSLE